MILSTHAIVGAAIASFLPSHPTTAFVLGFASHFVLDAIPHWDYPIRSAAVDPKIGAPMTFDRALLRDAVVIGSDGVLGILGTCFSPRRMGYGQSYSARSGPCCPIPSTLFTLTSHMNRCGPFSDFIAGFIPTRG